MANNTNKKKSTTINKTTSKNTNHTTSKTTNKSANTAKKVNSTSTMSKSTNKNSSNIHSTVNKNTNRTTSKTTNKSTNTAKKVNSTSTMSKSTNKNSSNIHKEVNESTTTTLNTPKLNINNNVSKNKHIENAVGRHEKEYIKNNIDKYEENHRENNISTNKYVDDDIDTTELKIAEIQKEISSMDDSKKETREEKVNKEESNKVEKTTTIKKTKRRVRIVPIILLIITLVLLIVLNKNVNRIDIIPFKYAIIIYIFMYFMYFIFGLLILLKNKVCRVIGYIFLTIILIISSIGIYYTNTTIKFFENSFNNISSTYTNKYVIISTEEHSDVLDYINKNLSYYSSIPHIDKAIDKLKETIDFDTTEYTNILDLFNNADDILIEKTLYESLKENIKTIDYSKYKIVYEYEVTIDEEINPIELGDVINIYIGGVDFTETFNDFNMIVTINRKTKKILLTSIPRDYYMDLPSLGAKDILDYTLLWGVNVPIEALENMFDTKIDYYVTVNTKSLVGLVDALGGVEFCADFAFRTTHATILETYDDRQGQRLYVQKGCKEYNGIEILTIARERLVFEGGDRQRQKNCQQIMINIANKMASFDSIANYKDLLDKLSDLYATNIPDKLVTSIVKDTVDGSKWSIETQSADGRSGAGWVHIGTYYGSVMIPYDDSVASVTNKLKSFANE
ncbi:MAG: LCP family protein [Bacilli bacterium]|nr:LCP family protein [Bacilli bacterium]